VQRQSIDFWRRHTRRPDHTGPSHLSLVAAEPQTARLEVVANNQRRLLDALDPADRRVFPIWAPQKQMPQGRLDAAGAMEDAQKTGTHLVEAWVAAGEVNRALSVLEYLRMSDPAALLEAQQVMLEAIRESGGLQAEWQTIRQLRDRFGSESEGIEKDKRYDDQEEVWTERLIEAADLYTAHWPDDEKAPAVRHKAAFAAYTLQDYPDARDRFADVIAGDAGSEQAGMALDLMLDTHTREQDWAGAADTWLDLSTQHPDLTAELDVIERLAIKMDEAGDTERAEALRDSL